MADASLYDRLASLSASQLEFLVNRLDLDKRFLTSSAPPASLAAEIHAQLQQRGEDAIKQCKNVVDDVLTHSAKSRWKAGVDRDDSKLLRLVRQSTWLLVLTALLLGPAVSEILAGRWPKLYLAIVAVAVSAGAAYLAFRSSLTRVSHVSSSEVLSTFVAEHEGLFGRITASEALATLCLQSPFVHLIGESGVGKSSVLKNGLPSAISKRKAVQYLYVERCGDFLDEGPRQAIVHALFETLESQTLQDVGASRNMTNADFESCLVKLHVLSKKTIIVALDGFDDYVRTVSNKLTDSETYAWISPHMLLEASEFWRIMHKLSSRGIIRVLLAARIDEKGGLSSFCFVAPRVYALNRLSRTAASTFLARLTDAGFVSSPQSGWHELSEELVSDLNSDDEETAGADRVLPIQMVVALKGLESLKSLTSSEYHRAGRLTGLERRFVQDGTRLGSVSSGLSQSEVLSTLLALCAENGKPVVKDVGTICSDLQANGCREIGESQMNDCLSELERQLIVRRVHAFQDGITRWTLYHSYLVRGVFQAEKFERKWEALLRERHREFTEANSIYTKWSTLLSPLEQVVLAIRLRKSRRTSGMRKYLRLSRLRWCSYLALFAGVLVAADAGIVYPGSESARRLMTSYDVSMFRRTSSHVVWNKQVTELQRLIAAELLSRRRIDGWIAGLRTPPPEVDYWSHAQSSDALLRSSGALDKTPPPVRDAAYLMFTPGAPVTGQDGTPFGWRAQEGQEYTRIEPALWTLSALAIVRNKGGSVSAEQVAFIQRTLDRYYAKQGAWNLGPDESALGTHSVYEAALAQMALLDARAAGIDVQVRNENTNQLLMNTAKWLIQEQLHGGGTGGWGDGEDQHVVSPALSLQVYAVLLRTELETGLSILDQRFVDNAAETLIDYRPSALEHLRITAVFARPEGGQVTEQALVALAPDARALECGAFWLMRARRERTAVTQVRLVEAAVDRLLVRQGDDLVRAALPEPSFHVALWLNSLAFVREYLSNRR